ncbi:MAG: ArsR/SmtB family transcription factor [Candidatus Bathyarchaeia archaeon]
MKSLQHELTQPTTSRHLGILERVGLVSSRHEGRWVFYRLTNPRVKTILEEGAGIALESA